MMVPDKFKMPEVVDQQVVRDWRGSIKRIEDKNCPEEVTAFINTIAYLLGDFAQYKVEKQLIKGFDLILCGNRVWNSQTIDPWTAYEIKVPVLQAVDHYAAMHLIFKRKGKQGLIDYCRARVKDTEIERVLQVLNVEVFHIERPEFKYVMDQIKSVA
jgi:hypothetical protein